MITFRPFSAETDYATLQSWWAAHGVPAVSLDLLPRGFIAEAGGVAIAASFLYLDPGMIGVIEWTTTNPKVATGPDSVRAVRGLYEQLESTAKLFGCVAVISFVNPNSWERRTMAKMGYTTSGDSIPHLMFAKSLRPKPETLSP